MGAGLVAHEQGALQLFLKGMDTGADSGLADVEPVGSCDEVSDSTTERNVRASSVSMLRPGNIDDADIKGGSYWFVKTNGGGFSWEPFSRSAI